MNSKRKARVQLGPFLFKVLTGRNQLSKELKLTGYLKLQACFRLSFLVFFLTGVFKLGSAQAAMAPRMYSIMLQGSASFLSNNFTTPETQKTSKFSLDGIYLIRNGPSFGFRYLYEVRNELSEETGEGYGPLAGYYHDSGAFFLIQYDILAKLGTWRNGEGPQVDLGYVDHIGKQFHVGLKYSYRQIRYKTDLLDNTAFKRENSDIFLSFVLMYLL